MTIYQCLKCRKYYGWHENKKLKGLKPFDPKTHTRYLDCDVWRCPHCNNFQDTRDVYPSFGTRGGNQLRQLSETEVQAELLGDREAQQTLGWYDLNADKFY